MRKKQYIFVCFVSFLSPTMVGEALAFWSFFEHRHPRAHRARKTETWERKNGLQKKKKRGEWPAEPFQPGKKETNSQKYM